MSAVEENESASNADSKYECRSCLQTSDPVGLHSLFQSWSPGWGGMESTMAEDLAKIANIQISETDRHSKFICLSCSEQLKAACQFISLVQNNDKIQRLRYTTTTEDISCKEVWPKPIQIEKTIGFENWSDVDVKQEVLSEHEYDCNPDDGFRESDFNDQIDIKVEPEEIVASESKITINDHQMSPPKKKRALWTEDNLKEAIVAVQTNELSQRAAAKKYHIPRRTLRNHLISGVMSKVLGKQTILTKHQEDELCQRIKKFAEIGLTITAGFIRKQAFQFCLRYDIRNKFDHKKGMASRDWLRLFLKRNPSIPKRHHQTMAQKLDKSIVQHYFHEVRRLYDVLNILDHPERLYNMDEKVCRITVHPQNTVLVARGSKRVRLVAPKHAENVTIAKCVNASGTTIPPMIIFKGQRHKPEPAENFPAGTLVRMAKTGSMTLDLFIEYIQHIGRHKVPGKCLLIFDGTKSYMSYEAIQEAEKYCIVLYCLPSNTTHELQPLDNLINKSFEHYWDKEVLRVLNNKPDTRFTNATYNKIFNNTWPKCMTHTNIVNGFRATGLFPFNPEAIPDEAYKASCSGLKNPILNIDSSDSNTSN